MVPAHKILTVTYGTFSCTLEGFEDPFAAMTEIAEYFRDLAAKDRFFGAEPPTPDMDKLERIAASSMSGAVKAENTGGRLVLRPEGLEDETRQDPAYAAEDVGEEYGLTESPEEGRTPPTDLKAESDDPQDFETESEVSEDSDVASETVEAEADAEPEDEIASTDVEEEIAEDEVENESAPEAHFDLIEAAENEGMAIVADAIDASDEEETSSDDAEAIAAAVAVETSEDEIQDEAGIPDFILTDSEQDTPEEAEAEEAVSDSEIVDFSKNFSAWNEVTAADRLARLRDAALDEDVSEDAYEDEDLEDETDEAALDTTELADVEPVAEIDDADAPDVEEDVTAESEKDELSVSAGVSVLPNEVSVQEDDASADDIHDEADAVDAVEEHEVVASNETEADVDLTAEADPEEARAEMAEAETDEVEIERDAESDTGPLVLSGLVDTEADAPETNDLEKAQADTDEVAEVDEPTEEPVEDEASDDDKSLTADLAALFSPRPEETEAETSADEPVPSAHVTVRKVRKRSLLTRIVRPNADLSAVGSDAAPDPLEDDEEADLMAELAAIEAELARDATGATESAFEAEDDIDAEDQADAEDDEEEASLLSELAEIQREAAADDQVATDQDAADADAEDEVEAPETAVAETEAEETAAGAAEEIEEAQTSDREPNDLERLFAATDSRLSGEDASRRHANISHLKAAVAARRADDTIEPLKPTNADAYREDLANTVRPRRATSKIDDDSEATGSDRGSPLVLISEQRVESTEMSEAEIAGSAEPEFDIAEGLPKGMPAPSNGDDFEQFAEDVGAVDLPDILEAAAVFSGSVMGQETFSRPRLLHLAAEAVDDLSREDGLRGFGQLLRDGTIRKVGRGTFRLGVDSRFKARAPRRAG